MATLRPTFSESWYRVADLRVKLRSSAQISRQFYRGDRWYVVRDPAGNQYHRLSAPAYAFVGLLDGTRTVAEAWDVVGGQMADDAPTQNEVIQILSQLHSANLVESNVTPDAAVLLRRHKKMVQRQWQGRLMNILFPRIPLWDPDEFLKRWMPVMRYLLSAVGGLLWLGVLIAAAILIAPRWNELQSGAMDAIHPQNWPFLWASFILIKAIHELGHGFFCRRFGGEVHEMGVMFLVLVPAPYVDATSAWGFPSKWHRILVGAGGMIFELFVAAIAAFVWLNTAGGTLPHQLAYNVMLIASVSTVVFNANPLLRYDGYYILADWLEIPNLRYRSSEYSMGLIKRHLFKVKLPTPLPPPRQRVWLLLYAITSTIYRTFVGIMIILMVWTQVPVLGVLMALGGVVTWLVVPIVKLSKYLLIEPELHRKRWRAAGWVAAMAGAVVVLIGVIKFPLRYETTAISEPAMKQTVFAGTSGTIDQIVARDGAYLKKGDVILVCRDRELELQIAQVTARLAVLKAKLDSAIVNDQGERKMVLQQITALNKELARGHDRLEKLTVRAPADGRLIAAGLGDLVGRYIHEGEELAMVGQMERLRLVAMFDQSDAALPFFSETITKGGVVEADVKPAGDVGRTGLKAVVERDDQNRKRLATPTFEVRHPALAMQAGGDAQLDPNDKEGRRLMTPQIEMWLVLDNPDHRYVPGQRMHLRFELDRKPLYWNWSRRIWQLIQSHSKGPWI